jgi:4-amino-4-deoxy-L-arabinose transferase-like glycosyltransferase
MALKSDVLPRLIHFSYLLLTLGALGAFATRYWQRKTGLLAAALFVSIPTVVQIATWSYVDVTLTFYNFTAIYALVNWLNSIGSDEPSETPPSTSSTEWLVLAGLCSGASLSIKYTAVVTLLVLAAILFWSLIRRRLTIRRFFAGGLVIVGLALAVAAPWYVKNAVVTGNPLYPLMWGGKGWNEVATRWLLVPGQKMSLLDLLIVPWTLTVMGTQGTVAFDSTYSPLFLALLPLLLIVRRQAQGLGALLLAAAVGYIFWIVSGGAAYGTFILRGRQVLPIFAPLSLLCAYSLDGIHVWDRPSFSLQRVLRMIVILTLAFGLLSQILLTVGFNPWPYLVGHQSRGDYLERYTTQHLHQTVTYLNQNLTDDDKVLFIWEPRSYGLTVPHKADVLLDNFAQQLHQYGSPEGVLTGLRDEGYTHILVNQFVYPWIVTDFPITPEEQAAWEEFEAQYLTDDSVIHTEEEFFSLYRLPSTAGP